MDFKNTEEYIKAMKSRDWMMCDLIAKEHMVLVEIIKQLQVENKKLKECLVDIESKEITTPEIDAVYMKSLAQCCLIELEEGE